MYIEHQSVCYSVLPATTQKNTLNITQQKVPTFFRYSKG